MVVAPVVCAGSGDVLGAVVIVTVQFTSAPIDG
jgi:hypothetical protein